MATHDENRLSAAELEAAFQATRDRPPMPSRALWERVLADSEAHLPAPPKPVAPAPPRFGLFAGFLAAIGGWGGLAGLTSAAAAGLWIGYAHPAMVPHPRGAGPMAGGGQAGFELEDFEPRYVDFPLLDFPVLLEEG